VAAVHLAPSEHVERAAKESETRPHVRDDFGWLQGERDVAQFQELAQEIVSVPTSAIDAEHRKGR
jgi:hypothetical protein